MLSRGMNRFPPTLRRMLCTSSGSGESHYRSLAKATLIGRTGSKAEIYDSTISSGRCSAMLPIATTGYNGDTNWFRVFISDATPGYSLIERLAKGSQLYIEGGLKINSVEKEGEFKQYVNIHVSPGMGMFRVLKYGREEGTEEKENEDLPF